MNLYSKEQKYNKKLVAAQGKHNEATVALNKARELLEHHQTEHRNLIAARDAKKNEAEQARLAKQQHDQQRQAALTSAHSPATSAVA